MQPQSLPDLVARTASMVHPISLIITIIITTTYSVDSQPHNNGPKALVDLGFGYSLTFPI